MARRRSLRCAALVAILSFAALTGSSSGGQDSPKLSRAQRSLLEALVTAVDARAASPAAERPAASWQMHRLRASDGSHYLAVKARLGGVSAPAGPVLLYARLATRLQASESPASMVLERSAVLEWLRGLRSDPMPMRAARSTTVNAGEMPVGGTAAAVGDVGADATAALRLVTLQQEREARRKADADERRRQELEGRERRPQLQVYPFEDFDVAAQVTPSAHGVEVARSFTAGPGDYHLTIAWAEPATRRGEAPTIRVLTEEVSLPAATMDFAIGDVIVASSVAPLTAPYPPSLQAGHPYALGVLEAVPAPGNRLSADGTLGVVYQVVNASGTAAGKPDVEVGFQLLRLNGQREEPFGRLETQRHTADSLPADFDVAKRHPLFGGVRAPLTSFPRGRYRLEVTAVDRLAGRRTTSDTVFDVVGTPESLLREAPALGQPFRRTSILGPATLRAFTERLAPPSPSSGLTRLLAAAAEGRFSALIQPESVTSAEQGTALALRALGLFGLGDSPVGVGALLHQAATLGTPSHALALLHGAVAAAVGDDRSAVAAWSVGRDDGMADSGSALALLDALLRIGRTGDALALATAAAAAVPDDPAVRQRLAAVYLATGRYREAVAALDAAPAAGPSDLDGDFLRLHAFFALATAPQPAASDRERFRDAATRYLSARGPHAGLVEAWLQVVPAVAAR